MIYYSKINNGFYDDDVHSVLPEDAVEVSVEERNAVISGQSRSKKIVGDENGKPILVDVVATPEQAQIITNIQARNYLASTDWYVMRKLETGVEIPEDILNLRQTARESIIE